MRIHSTARLLAVMATAFALPACLGTGASSPEQPVPLVALSPGSSGQDSHAGLSPEEARAQAIAAIRAKAQAHESQHDEAPYPNVFATHAPPMAITHEHRSQKAIEAELNKVRRELEEASAPEEVAELEERMAELQALGRDHERESEEKIRAISEEMR